MPQRLFALLLCAALLISAVPPALAEDQPIEAERFVAPTLPPDAIAWDKNHPDILDEDMLYAHSAILIEADTGEVLFEKNADEIMYPRVYDEDYDRLHRPANVRSGKRRGHGVAKRR